MSIKEILERIEGESESTVDGILEKARMEAASIADQYGEKARKLEEKLQARAKIKARGEEKKLIVNEQLELKKSYLAKKREILEEIYEEAGRKIRSLSGGEYLDMLRGLILSRAVTGREELIVPPGQEGLFDADFIGSLNSGFPSGGDFSISGDKGDFTWGVVLREGRRIIDLSFDVLYEQLKEEIEPELSSVLFTGDG